LLGRRSKQGKLHGQDDLEVVFFCRMRISRRIEKTRRENDVRVMKELTEYMPCSHGVMSFSITLSQIIMSIL
jgi:hypothetical protein